MERQQNTELYTEGTQNKNEIRCKSLEAVLNLDNENFFRFLERQSKISKVIILDTGMFMPLSLNDVIRFIDYPQGNDIKERLENVFSKTKDNLSYLSQTLKNNPRFFITNEVINEINKWNMFWKIWINLEDVRITEDSGLVLRKDKEYISEVIKRNKSLHSLLKSYTRDYMADIINVMDIFMREKRILPFSHSLHQNYAFKTSLKNIIWNIKFNGRKGISEEDREITYNLFLNALNCSTGLLSMDEDLKILTSNVARNILELNKNLKKHDLYVKSNDYNEKFFTYFMHVGHF